MPNQAQYNIFYNNKNITTDISQYLVNLTYTDKTEKEADELDLSVEDTHQLWQNEWYPEKGASISAQIIQEGLILNCGLFFLDEIGFSGSKGGGDTVTLKCISTGSKTAIRTKQSSRHENKTLSNIANTIAAAHGLTVVGSVPNITLGGITQNNTTDLAFLERIGHQYGVLFSVKGTQLVFTSIFELERKDAVATFDKSDLTDWNILDKSFSTYAQAQSKFFNPDTKKLISSTSVNNLTTANEVNSDTLAIKTRTENTQQADLKAKVALYRANSQQQSGNIVYPGNVLAVAGNNITLQGLGFMSGKYHLTQSTHTVSKDGGYVGSAEIKRLGLIAAEKRKSSALNPSPIATSLTD